MNTHTQNHGFSTVIFVIIIAIIIGLLGFLGWRAWEAASKEPASSSTESTNKVGVGGEIPATLERISTASDSYTVPLPEGWLYGVCEDTDILFLAPSEELLGRCNSGYFGAISISRNGGDTRAESDPTTDPSVTNVEITDVTIDGQAATKTSYTVGANDFTPTDTDYIRYQVFYEGNTYTLGTSSESGLMSFADELEAIIRSFRFAE